VALNPRDAVIVDYGRSAMGRSKNGCFRNTRGDTISAEIVKALLKRNEALNPEEVDDFIWGCVIQREENGFNVGRNIWLLANLPHTVPGQTVNRLCGSSMTAMHIAAANIVSGQGDVYVVGGVEHLGHLSMTEGVDPNPLMGRSVAKAAGSMGMTAEYLAMLHGITREQMDAFAVRSHPLAHQARGSDKFEREIFAVPG